jgi:hypothetical protein
MLIDQWVRAAVRFGTRGGDLTAKPPALECSPGALLADFTPAALKRLRFD